MQALVRWQTFVGGIRHKLPIGIVVLAAGIVLLVIGGGRGSDLVSGFLVGFGAGVALIGLGER